MSDSKNPYPPPLNPPDTRPAGFTIKIPIERNVLKVWLVTMLGTLAALRIDHWLG